MKGAGFCSLYQDIHYNEIHYNKIWVYHIILVGTYVPMQFGIVMERFSENRVWRPEINFGHFGMLDAPPF